MYQMAIRYTQYCQIFQMGIKYTNIFHSEALQKYPNWYFWFETIPSGNPVPLLVRR
jgi:hypothetical protein